ncbi:hypothetical protein NQZ68_003576 [Dissostichus eleginoides]|nr:hypothetical protein NQZ68_003576 [Dissostichus eleginoides]
MAGNEGGDGGRDSESIHLLALSTNQTLGTGRNAWLDITSAGLKGRWRFVHHSRAKQTGGKQVSLNKQQQAHKQFCDNANCNGGQDDSFLLSKAAFKCHQSGLNKEHERHPWQNPEPVHKVSYPTRDLGYRHGRVEPSGVNI